jgi:hypothetical protein
MNTALCLLACYGMTFFFQQKSGWFTDPIRERIALFDKLLSCTFCTGFWVGMVCWLLLRLAEGLALEPTSAIYVVLYGFASGAFCYATDAGVQWLEENRPPG